jgi:hypothetical protein
MYFGRSFISDWLQCVRLSRDLDHHLGVHRLDKHRPFRVGQIGSHHNIARQ